MTGRAADRKESLEGLRQVIARHWGFRDFRPLQEPAMEAVLAGRDSLVVLPTGGGKSLCYQAPAVLRGDTTVVVSPLISLMKDQVDGLRASGVAATQLDSSQTSVERSAATREIQNGAIRLLFVSPERLVMPSFQELLQQLQIRTFAIDEAHCISHWGHDFRPEYRQLNQLKQLFPQASIHAYTATATERVRRDIVDQLALHDPAVLVGDFDRPNLTYRILPRIDVFQQVLEIIGRHANEAGIIYCIRRKDVDALAAALNTQGLNVRPYHAGLSAEERKETQDAFANEQVDLVVATVAFGMGIDRSNLRFVLHAAIPKSLEHYQQEVGRAGRDGLEAECVLLYSGQDVATWRSIVQKSGEEPGIDPDFVPNMLRHLEDMNRYCRAAVCRHRALVGYFGQRYESESCHACDVCLGDTELVPEGNVIAQKILSCVARIKERFGINQVIGVLRGENTEKIRDRGHDQLSTFGLLKGHDKAELRDWVYQLIGQDVLQQDGDEYPLLKLKPASWEVMKGQRTVRLVQPVRRAAAKSKADTASWEGVDQELFDALRELRRRIAAEQSVPPYVVFSDATLRELARVRPSSLERMRLIYGIGDTKLKDYGPAFWKVISEHCEARGLSRDNPSAPSRLLSEPRPVSRQLNPQRDLAFDLFRRGRPIAEVIDQTGRARSTVTEYLCDFIRETRPKSIAAWVADDLYQSIAVAGKEVGLTPLKPIYLALGERVSYDEIRLVVTHLTVSQSPQR